MPILEHPTALALQHILLATDLSPTSYAATRYAEALAQRYSSRLEVANVIDLSGNTVAFAEDLQPILQSFREAAIAGLHRVAGSIHLPKVEMKALEAFIPAEAILAEAFNSHADLIVLGTSSKKGLTKFLLGSTAEEVIRKATCPVFSVGPQVHHTPAHPLTFKSILFATDLSPRAEKAFHYALSLASQDNAILSVCRVISEEPGSPTEEEVFVSSAFALKALAEKSSARCNLQCVIKHGKASEQILALADRTHADLIVLGARRSSLWINYVHPGLTPALLAAASCPVLTIC